MREYGIFVDNRETGEPVRILWDKLTFQSLESATHYARHLNRSGRHEGGPKVYVRRVD